MKNLKLLLTLGLLLTSMLKVQANDYALLDTYPLLNDMKMVKANQMFLDNFKALISNHSNDTSDKLLAQKQKFSTILNGLSSGDSKLGLRGTELKPLRNKINTIQQIWSEEHMVLTAALKNPMYEENALSTLHKLSEEFQKLDKLYQQSYTRYKKNSVMKSLVRSYMRSQVEQQPIYAVNMVK